VTRYVQYVVTPLRALIKVSLAGLDAEGVVRMLRDIVTPGSVNDHVAEAYEKYLFGKATL
jgi:hypothetical protein